MEVPEELKKHFDGQKLILPVDRQLQEELLHKWHTDAHNAIIDCLAREKYKRAPSEYAITYQTCSKMSRTISARATCFIELERKIRRNRKNKKKLRRRRKRATTAEHYSLKHSSSDSILTRIARSLEKIANSFFGYGQKRWNSLKEELKSVRQQFGFLSVLKKMMNKVTSAAVDRNMKEATSYQNNGDAFVVNPLGGRHPRIRLLSPGIYPDDPNEINILSPRIPVDAESPEAKAWIEFILSVSGVKARVEETIESLKSTSFTDRPLRLTEKDVENIAGKEERKKIEIVRKMETMYTQKQKDNFRNRGFAFMTKDQLEIMYNSDSPLANSLLLRETSRKSRKRLEKGLINAIRFAAKRRRRKRYDTILGNIAFSTFVNEPPYTGNTVLSPVLFSVFVSAPVVIGPLILSPWVFSPIILSPWIFSPIVLSPFAFSPLILSPFALSVYVLSPGIFSPAILSPLVMVPYILSPFVGSPFILNPLVLSPYIMNPIFASPAILSPSVLSPFIYSPSLNSSIILSPSVFSPPIESESEGSDVILSPSI